MIEKLTSEQRDAVLRYLLHRMGAEVRYSLMAEMPVAYARMYPSASAAVVERVSAALLAPIPRQA